MINWIEKWLIDRRQRVVVDGEVSNWEYRTWERRCTVYNGWYCTKYYHKVKGLSAELYRRNIV